MELWLRQLVVVAENHENIILTGDLNAKHPLWYNSTTNKLGEILGDFLLTSDSDLLLVNDDSRTYKDSVIDLTIVKGCRNIIRNWEVDEKIFVRTDHHMIRFAIKKNNERRSITRWNTNKADWEKFKDTMEQKLKNIKEEEVEDPDMLYDKIKCSIRDSAEDSVPRLRVNGKHKSWWDEELEEKYKEMKKAKNLYTEK